MNAGLKEKCDLFIKNRDALRDTFKWDGDLMIMHAAMLLTTEGISADIEEMKKCEALLKSRTGLLSPLRGRLKLIMLCYMLTAKDREAFFDDTERAYSLIRICRGKRDDMFYLAAVILSKAVTDKEQLLGLVDDANEIYSLMRSSSRHLADKAGYVTAAAIAASDVQDPKALIEEAKACREYLGEGFGNEPDAEALSLMLALDDADTALKCTRLKEITGSLEDKGVKWQSDALPVIGALTRLDLSNAEIVENLLDAAEYLRTQKGFGMFGSGGSRRLSYAAMLVLTANMKVPEAADLASAAAVDEAIRMQHIAMTHESLLLCSNMGMMIRGGFLDAGLTDLR